MEKLRVLEQELRHPLVRLGLPLVQILPVLTLEHAMVPPIITETEIEDGTDYRQQRDDQQPCDLAAGISRIGNDDHDDADHQDGQQNVQYDLKHHGLTLSYKRKYRIFPII